ncbi:MAG: baseplate J/gp47 family protein [Deltaproteobacteria bacterium]|nr:baseplate J/gp47 family protein [Deltaproteobacteria bacterium]
MPFERPSLTELIAQADADIASRLPGADTTLRRSNLAVLARVSAGAVHGLYGYLGWLAKQLMPDTAEADYLARWAGIWGVQRKAATAATGAVTVSGTVGSVVPAGSVMQRSDLVRFAVVEEVTLAAATTTVEVRAEETGTDGNTAAAAPMSFVSPITGVNTVASVGEDGLSGGTDAENDAALLARLLLHIQEPPHGGSEADYEAWSLEISGVTRAWAYANYLGLGTVGVCFVMDDKPGGIIPDAGEVEAVQAYIDELRPVTAQVTVFAPTPVELDFEISLTPDTTTVRAAVAAELADLIAREAVPGGTLLISHIREAVSIAAGETDHVITSPAADVTVLSGEITTLGDITWS